MSCSLWFTSELNAKDHIESGADPGFFPRGGQVGQSARETPPALGGTVRRGVWGASPKKI